MEKRTLIAYYSWSGSTRRVAEALAAQTGGDLLEIEPETAYAADYDAVVEQARAEIADGYRPPLKGAPQPPDGYDVIYVGTPNWWSSLAPPMASYLAQNSWAGKAVLPFCTHGGGGAANTAGHITQLCPGARVGEGFAVYGDGGARLNGLLEDWLAAAQPG